LATAGDAIVVDEGATLVFTATVTPSLDAQKYVIKWTSSDTDKATVATQYTQTLTNTITGVAAGAVNIVAEVVDLGFDDGSPTYTALDPVVNDTFALTVETP
jgi:uncharacterized protein YjdB